MYRLTAQRHCMCQLHIFVLCHQRRSSLHHIRHTLLCLLQHRIHFAHLALTVRKAQLLVTCVVREASALEAHQPLRNALPAPTAALVRASAPTALPALTAVLEKASVHSALLALTAVMVRKNVQNALKDPSALRDPQFQ